MTVEELKRKSDLEVLKFIRERLTINAPNVVHFGLKDNLNLDNRLRFDMSGTENIKGQCTLYNLYVLNLFADLGIYDYTHYLFLDFHKGIGTLFLRYFNEDDNLIFDLGAYSTSNIILFIFNKTIFSNKQKRIRS